MTLFKWVLPCQWNVNINKRAKKESLGCNSKADGGTICEERTAGGRHSLMIWIVIGKWMCVCVCGCQEVWNYHLSSPVGWKHIHTRVVLHPFTSQRTSADVTSIEIEKFFFFSRKFSPYVAGENCEDILSWLPLQYCISAERLSSEEERWRRNDDVLLVQLNECFMGGRMKKWWGPAWPRCL